MAESALTIANTFLDIAEEHHQKLTPLKLLKLVYFAHGWYLALTEKPLIDESVEAWKFGPVVPSIYHTFKRYRDRPIDGKESTLDMKGDNFNFVTPLIEKGDSKNMRVFLEKIWDVYGKLGAGQLSNLTHEPNSPWSEIWSNGGMSRKGTDIPDKLIQSYFKKKIVTPPTPATTEQTSGGG